MRLPPGVPKVLSRWISRSLARDVAHRLAGAVAFELDLVGLRLGDGRRHQLPERGHLDRLVAELHVGQAETAADDPAVPEELLDLVRMRRRADVEVLRPSTEQQVAHAATDEVGRVVGLVQPREHLQRIGVDGRAGNRMVGSGDDDGLGHRTDSVADPDPSQPTELQCFQHVTRDSGAAVLRCAR